MVVAKQIQHPMPHSGDRCPCGANRLRTPILIRTPSISTLVQPLLANARRDESTLELNEDLQLVTEVLRPTRLDILFLALELRVRVRLGHLAEPRLFLLCNCKGPPVRISKALLCRCGTCLLSVNLYMCETVSSQTSRHICAPPPRAPSKPYWAANARKSKPSRSDSWKTGMSMGSVAEACGSTSKT